MIESKIESRLSSIRLRSNIQYIYENNKWFRNDQTELDWLIQIVNNEWIE